MKKILFYLAAIAAVISCNDVDLDDVDTISGGGDANMVEVMVDVSLEGDNTNGSRLVVDDSWNVSWAEGDELLAWSEDSNVTSKFTMSDDDPDAENVIFTGEVTENSAFRLIYPYSEDAYIYSLSSYGYDTYGYQIDVTTQEAGVSLIHMVSSDLIEYDDIDKGVSMKHICALAELQMTFPTDEFNGYTVKSVVLTGLASKRTIYLNRTIDDDEDDIFNRYYYSTTWGTITVTDGITTVSECAASVRISIIPCEVGVDDAIEVTTTLSDSDGNDITLMRVVKNINEESVEFLRATYNYINCNFSTTDIFWTSFASSSFADNSSAGDSSADPIEISSAEDLAKIAVDVNSGTTYSGTYFKLTQDIDLAGYKWVAIGTYSNKFQGVFDGDNHEIKGLYIETITSYQGLFGYISGATIENVGMDSSCEISLKESNVSGSYVGGIVGYSMSSTIDNCYNKGVITTEGSFVGGIVGQAGYSTISDCYNEGDITANIVGGIAGRVQNYGTETSSYVTNCYNEGKITGGYIAGGVLGYAYAIAYTTPSASIFVTNCYNEGEVISSLSSTETAIYLGGVVGGAYAQAPYGYPASVSVVNSYNQGSVTAAASSTKAYVGGIVGYAYAYGSVSYTDVMANVNIINSYSSAPVSSASDGYVGGEVGYSYVGANDNSSFTVSNCYYDSETAVASYDGQQTYTPSTAVANTGDTADVKGLTTSYMQGTDFYNTLNSGAYTYNNPSLGDDPTVQACGWYYSTNTYPTLNFAGTPTSL